MPTKVLAADALIVRALLPNVEWIGAGRRASALLDQSRPTTGLLHSAIAFRPASVIFIQITDFSRPSRGTSVGRIVANPSFTSPANTPTVTPLANSVGSSHSVWRASKFRARRSSSLRFAMQCSHRGVELSVGSYVGNRTEPITRGRLRSQQAHLPFATATRSASPAAAAPCSSAWHRRRRSRSGPHHAKAEGRHWDIIGPAIGTEHRLGRQLQHDTSSDLTPSCAYCLASSARSAG
jgi:hypothetical protein